MSHPVGSEHVELGKLSKNIDGKTQHFALASYPNRLVAKDEGVLPSSCIAIPSSLEVHPYSLAFSLFCLDAVRHFSDIMTNFV
jgi:hypothetical protein